MTVAKPASRPNVPHFSSGPCAKHPGWNPQNLKDAALGRSHRAKIGKAKLKLAIELTREVLEVPADYKIGIVPASDTGAVEMALWSLLGARPVTTIAWESFGEGAHGMLILSPRAVERLETYKPAWPLPKIFRLTKGGKLNQGIFEGETINTPSMLCVEDYLDALNWAKSIGGLKALIARADANTKVLSDWKAKTPWIDFLAKDSAIRSNTSVCLKFIDPAITSLNADAQAEFSKKLVALVEKEGAGYDFAYYRDAPAGLRIWCGATVEASDVALLTQWIDWAFAETKAALPKAA